MGEVWKAYDTAMNRVVALKLLPGNLADDEQYQARFRREAQMAAGLDEPHIVPIHDFGEFDGRLYVTMRLIDGKTVTDLLAEGPLAPQRAVSIVEQIAAALNAAHRVGLVHRDVKPSNILVTEDDFAYLIDFGIARSAGSTKLTSTGSTVGTLAYMAPERFSTDGTDTPAADTYALTCVLYECLTGTQPFPGDSMERQVSGHLTLPPPRPSVTRPGLSPALDQVIATGMAKDPAHRYLSIKDLASAARAALTAPVVAPPHQQPTQAAAYPHPTPWHTPQPYPSAAPAPAYAGQPQNPSAWWRNPAVWMVAGLMAVVAVVAAVVLVVVWPRDSPRTTANPTRQAAPSASPESRSTPTESPSVSISLGPPAPSGSTPAGPAQLHTADGLTALLGTIREKFGDTMGFELVVYPDYAVTDRVDPANDRVKQDFMYRNGAWNSWGSDSTATVFDHVGDLSAFDVPAVAATLAGAPQTLGAPDNSMTYLIVEGQEGGGLELRIYSAAPGTGFMEVNADGSINKVYPP